MSSQVAGLRRLVGARGAAHWQPSAHAVIVVAGAVGGAGASTIAALLAVAAARGGRRTLLVDTDEVVGTLHRILGAEPSRGLAALQDADVALDDLLLPVADGCVLLPGGHGTAHDAVPFDTTARRSVMRRAAQRYGDFDAVVIDAGSRLDGILAAADPGLSRLLIVTGVTPVAIASAYAMVKTANARWRGIAVELLFNRQTADAGRAAFEQVHSATQRFLDRCVGFAGVLGNDDVLGRDDADPRVRGSPGVDIAMQQLATSLFTDIDAADHA
ncbi:MAG: MinD/ParA family ATP-binding protein [Gemmatimonadaceae bacterium]